MGRRPRIKKSDHGDLNKTKQNPSGVISSLNLKGDLLINIGSRQSKQKNDPLIEGTRRLVEKFKSAWERRYDCRPKITGKDRTGLAEALKEMGNEQAIADGIDVYIDDDWPERLGHSLGWFLTRVTEYVGKGRRKNRGTKKQARIAGREDDEDFEAEIAQFKKTSTGSKAQGSERPGQDRSDKDV